MLEVVALFIEEIDLLTSQSVSLGHKSRMYIISPSREADDLVKLLLKCTSGRTAWPEDQENKADPSLSH